MATICEIDEQMAILKLAKKNIIKERDLKTPVKQNDDLWNSITNWHKACKSNEEIAKEGGKQSFLNKKIWSHSVVSKCYFASDYTEKGKSYSYVDLKQLHQDKSNEEDKPIKYKYFMTVRTEIELEFYPSWKCPVCLKTVNEMDEDHPDGGDEVERWWAQIKELKCKHKICGSCFQGVMHNAKKCPLCRMDIKLNQVREAKKN